MSRALAAAFVVTIGTLTACEKKNDLPGNPPPPVNVPSTKPTGSTAEAPKPEPPAPKPSGSLPDAPKRQRITMAADGTCTYLHHFEADCEPNSLCNPPEPATRKVKCPEIADHTRVEKLEGKDCLATWFPKCPENVKCNPPPVEVQLPCDKAPVAK